MDSEDIVVESKIPLVIVVNIPPSSFVWTALWTEASSLLGELEASRLIPVLNDAILSGSHRVRMGFHEAMALQHVLDDRIIPGEVYPQGHPLIKPSEDREALKRIADQLDPILEEASHTEPPASDGGITMMPDQPLSGGKKPTLN